MKTKLMDKEIKKLQSVRDQIVKEKQTVKK